MPLIIGGVLALGSLAGASLVLFRRWWTELSLSPVRVSRPLTPQEIRGQWAPPPGCGFT